MFSRTTKYATTPNRISLISALIIVWWYAFANLSFVSAKLCPFFKGEGLICMKTRLKNVILDTESEWIISYGEDSDIIIWDLERMNDISTITGETSPIVTLAIDIATKHIYKLNSNGLLSILLYPDSDILYTTRQSVLKNPLDAFFHISSNFIFILTQDRMQIKAVNYKDSRSQTSTPTTIGYSFNQAFLRYEFFADQEIPRFAFYFDSNLSGNANSPKQYTVLLDFNGTNFIAEIAEAIEDGQIVKNVSTILSPALSVSVSAGQQLLNVYDYEQGKKEWTTDIRSDSATGNQIIIEGFKVVQRTTSNFVIVFWSDFRISIHDLLSGQLFAFVMHEAVSLQGKLAYFFDESYRLIVPDYSGNLLIFKLTRESNDSYSLKLEISIRMSTQSITTSFSLEPSYYVFETMSEIEGFYLLDASTFKYSSIKCFRSKSSFSVDQYQDSTQSYFGLKIDKSAGILVRYFMLEIDAWDLKSGSQIFYDDISLNVSNIRIVDAVFNAVSGVLLSIQFYQSIAVWNLHTGILVREIENGDEPIIHISKSDSITKFYCFYASHIEVIQINDLHTNSIDLLPIQLDFQVLAVSELTGKQQDNFQLIFVLVGQNPSYPLCDEFNCWIVRLFYGKEQWVDLDFSSLVIPAGSIDASEIPSSFEFDSSQMLFLCFMKKLIVKVQLESRVDNLISSSEEQRMALFQIDSSVILLPWSQSAYALMESNSRILISSGKVLAELNYDGDLVSGEIIYTTSSSEQSKQHETILISWNSSTTTSNVVVIFNSLFLFVYDLKSKLTLKSESYDDAPKITAVLFEYATLFVGYEDNSIAVWNIGEGGINQNAQEQLFSISTTMAPLKILSYLESEGMVVYEMKNGVVSKASCTSKTIWLADQLSATLANKIILESSIDPSDSTKITFLSVDSTMYQGRNNSISTSSNSSIDAASNKFYFSQLNLQTLTIFHKQIKLDEIIPDFAAQNPTATATTTTTILFLIELLAAQETKVIILAIKQFSPSTQDTNVSLHILSSEFVLLTSQSHAHSYGITDIFTQESPSTQSSSSSTSRSSQSSSAVFATYAKGNRRLKYWEIVTDSNNNITDLRQLGVTITFTSNISLIQLDFKSEQVIVSYQNSKIVHIFNLLTGILIKQIDSLSSDCTAIALNMEFDTITLAESIGTISVFSYSSFIPISYISSLNSQISTILISDSLSLLLAQTDFNSIFVYRIISDNTTLQTSDLTHTLGFFLQLENTITALVFEESTGTLFIGIASCVKAWDIQSGQQIGTRCLFEITNDESINRMYFVANSQQLIVFTQYQIVAFDVMLISSRKTNSETIFLMDYAIQAALYFPESALLLYKELTTDKTSGVIEAWDSVSEKIVLVHSGFICKPLFLFKVSSILAIVCPEEILLTDTTKILDEIGPIQLTNYPLLHSDKIVQSPFDPSLLYIISDLNTLRVHSICSLTSTADFSESLIFQEVNSASNVCSTDVTQEQQSIIIPTRILDLKFIDVNLLAVLCSNGSFVMYSRFLQTKSLQISNSNNNNIKPNSFIQDLVVSHKINALFLLDTDGNVAQYSLEQVLIEPVDDLEQEQLDVGQCAKLSNDCVSGITISFEKSFEGSVIIGERFQSMVIMPVIDCLALLTKVRASIVLVSLSTFIVDSILQIPSYGVLAVMLKGFTESSIILLTTGQVNVFSVKLTQENSASSSSSRYEINQITMSLEKTITPFVDVVKIEPNLLIVTCALGYQVLEIEQTTTTSSSFYSGLSSKLINKMRLPSIIQTDLSFDVNEGDSSSDLMNLSFRGYFSNGLFWHTFPVQWVNGWECYYEIKEAELWIVERTLDNLEKTYDMTDIEITNFYFLVHLDEMSALSGLPKLQFKYDSMLHLKSSSPTGKEIVFNDANFDFDITEWRSVTIENFTFLVSNTSTIATTTTSSNNNNSNNSNPTLSIRSSNGSCSSLSLINVDFTNSRQSNPSRTSASNALPHSTISLHIKGFPTVILNGIMLSNSSSISSGTFITLVDTIQLSISNVTIANSLFTNSTIVMAKQQNLSKKATNISLSKFTITNNSLINSCVLHIDNTNLLSVQDFTTLSNVSPFNNSSFLLTLNGVHNHLHYNSYFAFNSHLTYLTQNTAISQTQKSSFRYKITDSQLEMGNVTLASSQIANEPLITFEAESISLWNFTATAIQSNKRNESVHRISATTTSTTTTDDDNDENSNDDNDDDKSIRRRNLFTRDLAYASERSSGQSISLLEAVDYSTEEYDVSWISINFERKKDMNKQLMSSIDDSTYVNSNSTLSMPYEMTMYASNFSNSMILIQRVSRLNISSSSFSDISGFDHLLDILKSYGSISNSVFSRIVGGTLKGIIFAAASQLDVTSSQFRDNRGLSCPAVHISNSKFAASISSNTFSNNTASLVGGALCLFNVEFSLTNNTFEDNAALAGGAIYFYSTETSQKIQQTIISVKETNVFQGNSAQIFGDNIDCLPSELKALAEYVDSKDKYVINEYKSGANMDLHLILVDVEGRVVSVKGHENIVFALEMESFDGLRLNDYKSELLSHNETLNHSSFYLFSHQVIGTPLNTASLEFHTPGMLLDSTRPPIAMEITFRKCIEGEVYIQDTINRYYTCKDCPEGQYSIVFPQTHNVKCLLCPEDKANLCYRNIIDVKEGYWRSSIDSDEILHCSNNPENCLGKDKCKAGHVGILCENCDITGEFWGQSYARTGAVEYSCVECRQEARMNLYVIAQIFLMVVYLSWSVKQTIDRAKSTVAVNVMRRIRLVSLGRSCEISLTAAYIKIASHYFQIVSGLKYFTVPSFLGLDLIVDKIGDSFSKTAFSLDCFLFENLTSVLPLNFLRVIWLHVNTVVCILIFFVVYKLLTFCKRITPKSYIMSNAFILFSLFTQYSIMSVLISSLSCRSIDSKEYVRYFLEMECWSEEHIQLTLYLILPLLLIQILGLCWKFIALLSVRKSADNFLNMLRFGLLYLEYRPSAYYWEFIKTIERFLMIFFINFIDQNDSIKGVMCALVIFAYYLLLAQYRPYHKNSLNVLEKKSTIVQMLLYFLTAISFQEVQSDSSNLFANFIFYFNLCFVINLVYNVFENNKFIQSLLACFIQSIEKKFPLVYSCLKKISTMPQPHVRIRWRKIAQHVSKYLERKKKDKSAVLFPMADDRKNESYTLHDLQSLQEQQQQMRTLNLNNTNNITRNQQQQQHDRFKFSTNFNLFATLNSEASYVLNTDTNEGQHSTEGDQELINKGDKFKNISTTESIFLGGIHPATNGIVNNSTTAAVTQTGRNNRHLRFSSRQNSYLQLKQKNPSQTQQQIPQQHYTEKTNSDFGRDYSNQINMDVDKNLIKFEGVRMGESNLFIPTIDTKKHAIRTTAATATTIDQNDHPIITATKPDSPQNSDHKRNIVPSEYEVDTDSIFLKYQYKPTESVHQAIENNNKELIQPQIPQHENDIEKKQPHEPQQQQQQQQQQKQKQIVLQQQQLQPRAMRTFSEIKRALMFEMELQNHP